jgi:hypothetical protein
VLRAVLCKARDGDYVNADEVKLAELVEYHSVVGPWGAGAVLEAVLMGTCLGRR